MGLLFTSGLSLEPESHDQSDKAACPVLNLGRVAACQDDEQTDANTYECQRDLHDKSNMSFSGMKLNIHVDSGARRR